MNKVMSIALIMTILSGLALASSSVSADDDSVVDQINITVPVACTLSGTGTNSHNAEINNGQYNSAIGETTIKATCNDSNGFSIYAIGFTDDTPTKNVLTNSTLGSAFDIETGTLTNGADSQWAMKLSAATSPESTYPITIQDSFTSFQEVPDEYTLVAQRVSGTDVGHTSEGSLFKTTYQVYISPTQPAGTYNGQVKYRLIHPYNAAMPTTTFTVFYTGRPISNEPGQENPVTINMADIGVGEYNLLGSTDGSYDKLTPDTYYGGYYKNIVGSLSDFQYTNESDVYDGTNFDWTIAEPETTDAAHIIPEEDAVYYVKEVASDAYLRSTLFWTSSGGLVKSLWLITALDDTNYNTAGITYYIDDIPTRIEVDEIAPDVTFVASDSGNQYYRNPSILFGAEGENNQVAFWGDGEKAILRDDVEEFLSIAYWVTKDDYMVTSKKRRRFTTNGWQASAITATTKTIPTTITRWEE